MSQTPATRLDVRGKRCPIPILQTKRRMGALAPGERLEVLATDPHAPIDFKAYCAQTGHLLIEEANSEGVIRLVLEASAGSA